MLLSEGSGFWDHPGIISSAYIAAIGLHWSFYFFHSQPLLIHVTTPISEFLINLLGQLIYAILPQLFTAFVLPSLLLARLTARAIPKLLRCLIYSAAFLAVSYLTGAVYPIYMFLFGLIFAWLFVETRTIVWSFILYVMLKVFAG